MLIVNGHLTIRALRMEDKHILAKWMTDPNVLQYYQGRDQPLDVEKVTEIFYNPDPEEVQGIIEYEGVPIGYIQYYLLDEESRFTKVKCMPKHEWQEGQYRDCWLIEYKR